MRYWFPLFISCVAFLSANAQNAFQLKIKFEPEQDVLLKKIKYKTVFEDSIAVYKEAEKVTHQLQFKGYVLAEIASVNFVKRNVEVIIRPNQMYKISALTAGNLPVEVAQAVGFKSSSYVESELDAGQLTQLFENLLVYYDNKGYPFANISLDSIQLEKQQLSAKIKVQTNQRFTYDSLQIVGNSNVNSTYLQSYLNIKKGAYYREIDVANIESRLKELPYVNFLRSPEVSFKDAKAYISVFINKKNANQFDGILGLLPDQAGKYQLTGNLKLRLQNAFKVGELINFNYQGLPQKSQLLELYANVPNVFNSAFSINSSINLLKQDTSFLNVDTKIGFSYLFKGQNAVEFFVDHHTTNLVSVSAYKNAVQLPPILDANTTFYGLGLVMEKLDYRFNPQRGYALSTTFSVGQKKIKQNSAIPANLYQNIDLSSSSYRFVGKFSYYIPLAKQAVVALSNETGILNNGFLVNNELFRLGGQRSLRGFDELSILANAYSFINVETRYLLEQNGYLFAFYNQAYIQQKTDQINYSDFPLGFGAGINFETNLGIVSISYALGKQKNNPLNLRQGKIHFGIIALF